MQFQANQNHNPAPKTKRDITKITNRQNTYKDYIWSTKSEALSQNVSTQQTKPY